MQPDQETTRTRLRKQLIRWRCEREDQLSRAAAPALRGQLMRWLSQPAFDGIEVLGVYWPIRGEPDLGPCHSAWRAGGRLLALPRTGRDERLEFGLWDDDATLRPGRFSIPVPDPFVPVVPDLLIVPCVGFDARGYRLGYGGGYYDRTLARQPARTVGVAWDACELPEFEVAAHDRPLDVIVTESRILPGRGAAAARMP